MLFRYNFVLFPPRTDVPQNNCNCKRLHSVTWNTNITILTLNLQENSFDYYLPQNTDPLK